MERAHDRVGPVAFRLRRQPLDQDAHDQAAERGSDRDQPQPVRTDDLRRTVAFVRQAWRVVARQHGEEEPVREAQEEREDLGAERAHHAEEERVVDEPALARFGRGGCHDGGS
jgi:hypothetical protein